MTHGTVYGYRKGCRCDDCRHAETLRCRARSQRRRVKSIPLTVVHGLATTYGNWGCRCEPCTTAQAAYQQAWRVKAGQGNTSSRPPHGDYQRYSNHGCRCSRCRRAWANYSRDRYARTRGASA